MSEVSTEFFISTQVVYVTQMTERCSEQQEECQGGLEKLHIIYPPGGPLFVYLFVEKSGSNNMESLGFKERMRKTDISYGTFFLPVKLLRENFNP